MGYRNGTYVAFNGMGTTNPTESDMKYYGLLQSWDASHKYDFSFSDSHKKTYSVQDSSQLETLKARLLERLSKSKNMLLIATEYSSVNRGLLNWEIEKAVEVYKLPIIVVYPDHEYIQNSIPARLPDKLKEYINNNKVRTIHIPFKQVVIEKAIDEFNFDNLPKYTTTIYNSDYYKKLGLMK